MTAIVAAQSPTAPLSTGGSGAPIDVPPALPGSAPELPPEHAIWGWGTPGGTAGGGDPLHGNDGGTLTGDGTGMLTAGEVLPPRSVQSLPSQVQVWS